ncbi:MAG: peptidoglycan-binding protein [Candidatus Vogelbacteria bacterium]|nr:peptidoglycan-binding protein [Candidatus Vogelbacteria bacterium]
MNYVKVFGGRVVLAGAAFLAVAFIISPLAVLAAVVPTLTLTPATGSAYPRVTVYGEPNSAVSLHYGKLASSVNTMGSTDQNGSFSAFISQSGYDLACGNTAFVVVAGQPSGTIPWSPAGNSCSGLALSQTSVSLAVGQNTTIQTTGSSSLVISTNRNSAVASTTINNNVITITGLSAGNTDLTVCATAPSNICATVSVAVGSSNISFTPASITLRVNQMESIAIVGSGPYAISNNSVPGNVSVGISGDRLSVFGAAVGGSVVTVCKHNGGCGSIAVSVVSSDSIQTVDSNKLPSLASFSVSSNDQTGNFIKSGSVLSVSFTANKPVVNPTVTISGLKQTAAGSGLGPYTATSTITGSENFPRPISFGLSDLNGKSTNLVVFLSDTSAVNVVTPKVIAPTKIKTVPAEKFTFKLYLAVGADGTEVLKLQQLLKEMEFFTGTPNGHFGPATEKAVKALQKENGLAPAGYVGPGTRAVLNGE